MTPEEKSKMIMELMASRERDAERIRRDEARIDELLSKVDELLSLQRAAMAAEKQLDDYKQLNSNLLSKTTALEEQLKVRNKDLYVGKSQKGIHKKKRESVEAQSKETRLYRQGLSYRTMSADNTVCHDSDIRRLPAGAVIIKLFRKYAYEQVSRLVEHDYEVIRYKTSDGKIHKAISLSAVSLKSSTLFRARTLPVLSWLIRLSTNMFLTPLFIVKCTDCPVSQCI